MIVITYQGNTRRVSRVRRYKIFLADGRDESDNVFTVHCPFSGAMSGCDIRGSELLISESPNEKRKLRETWELIRVRRTWVGINTMMPNRVVEDGVRNGHIEELSGFRALRREVP